MNGKASGSTGACPICGRPVTEKFRPFCSRRCSDVDLARWLNGAYVVPGDQDGPLGEFHDDDDSVD